MSKSHKKAVDFKEFESYRLDPYQIFDVYCKEVRSLLELAVPVWHGGLTRSETNQIENIQKTAFKIILGPNYINYEVACTLLNTEPLELRRIQLCIKFVKKDLKKSNSLFSKNQQANLTRTRPKVVKEYQCRTSRYAKSSLPYLSKLINSLWRNNLCLNCSQSIVVTWWIMDIVPS